MVFISGGTMSDTQFIKGDKVKNFTVIDNTCLQDSNLSWGAKGFHSYLESLPGNWQIVKTDLVKRSKDKLYALNSIIEELEKAGYIVIEEQKRESNGRFGPKCYKVYEKPVQETTESHRSGFPDAVNPLADNPLAENQQLLNTKKLNTDIQKTKLTNYTDSETTVSESVLVNIIKDLFGGDYPFDKNFKADILKHLLDSGIKETNLEAYLKYVFERTKLGNVQKSFEGLFRKLALASSIARDFKNSSFIKKPEETKNTQQSIKYIDCPICSSKINRDGDGCPTCGTEMRVIRDSSLPDFIANKKIWKMSEDEKKEYELALTSFKEKIMREFKRPCVTREQYLQFWMNYGLLSNEEIENDNN